MSLSLEADDNRTIIPSGISPVGNTHIGLTTEPESLSFQVTGMGTDIASIDDSGYGPSRQSFAPTTSNIDREREGIKPFSKCVPLPLECRSNLRQFPDIPLDELTEQRFAELIPVVEDILKSITKKKYWFHRRMFLGNDDTDVGPYIVIFCNERYLKRIQHNVSKPRILRLCESGDLILRILVVPCEAQLAHSPSDVEVCRNKTTTLCGAPILLVNKSEDSCSGNSRKATIGGIIKITNADGTSKLCGMTAGHVLDDWQNSSVDTAISCSDRTDETDSFQDLDEPKPSPSHQTEIEYQNVLRGAWDFAETDSFGKIDGGGQNGSSDNIIQPSHDWALFTTKLNMPNELCALKSPGCFERRELKQAARPTFHGGFSEPVILIGGSNGPKRGELSSLTSRILIGSSGNFVDAYILTLNENNGIREGDSGSWVVHNGSPLVFGHVVATDVFGDAYVIPMVDTFDDIKRCIGAKAVELPTAKDFEVLETIETPDIQPFIEKPTGRTNRSDVDILQKSAFQPWGLQTPPFSSCSESHLNNWVTDLHELEANKPSCEPICDRNLWPTIFLSPREVCQDSRKENSRHLWDADLENEDELDNFAVLSNDANQFKVEVLKDFCRGTSLKDLKNGKGAAGYRRIVWLDDRDNTPGRGMEDIRSYQNPLTATGLRRALETPRFNNERLPDASRRLIYIMDLDPACIHALAETVSVNDYEGLGDAIYKYLTFQTSIEVNIPSIGFLNFQLDLHIPFFILEKSLPPKASAGTIKTKPVRQWTDLSFLRLDGLESQAQDSAEVWGIQEAQISCVVMGTDDWRWVAYCFVDSKVNGFLDDCSEADLCFDQIARMELEARFPLRQPRNYWIKVFQIRIASIGNQWEHNLHMLQRAIDTHFTQNSASPSLSRKEERRLAEIEAALDWAVRTSAILRRLTGALSETIDAWAKFSAPSGDIDYFEDSESKPQQSHNTRYLHAIKKIFSKLEGIYKAFLALHKRCAEYIDILKLRLLLESKEASDKSGMTSELAVSVFYPIALAASMFSMQGEAIPFEITMGSFIITFVILMFIIFVIRLTSRYMTPRWSPAKGHISKVLRSGLQKARESDELEIQIEKHGFP